MCPLWERQVRSMQALDRPHCVESAATRSSNHCLGIIKRPSRELVLMILGKLDEPLSLRISCSKYLMEIILGLRVASELGGRVSSLLKVYNSF